MIKNLLYSIFFHFLLIALIYANFNLKTSNEIETNQVSISLISKEEFESRFKTPKEEKEKKTSKKKSSKSKKEKPKAESKTEIKSEPKIESKSEPKPTSDSPLPVKEKPKKEKKEIKKEEKEVITKEEKKEKLEEVKKEPEKKPEPKEEKEPEKKDAKEVETQKEETELEDNKSDQNEKPINNLESLNLSFREKLNIRSQLSACYIRSLKENNLEEDKLSIIVSVEISQDGFITSDLEDKINDKRYNEDNDYKTIVNNVRRAIEFCSPLRNLPIDKYDVWKQVSLEFGKIEEPQTK